MLKIATKLKLKCNLTKRLQIREYANFLEKSAFAAPVKSRQLLLMTWLVLPHLVYIDYFGLC